MKFGDSVVIQHVTTSRTLACDPYEDIFPNWQKFLVSCTAEVAATARNTFRILRPPRSLKNKEDDELDPFLRYGQAFCLGCDESLLVSNESEYMAPTLYLASTLKNERTATKVSNKQAVYMSQHNDADSIWCMIKPSQGKLGGTERFMSNGSQILRGEDIVLTHRKTNTFLTTDPKYTDQTDFGVEYECFTQRNYAHGKLSLVESEFKGLSTTSTLSKADKSTNLWQVAVADATTAMLDMPKTYSTSLTFQNVAKNVRSALISQGLLGFTRLRKSFVAVDRSVKGGGDGKIDRQDIKDCLHSCNVDSRDLRYFDLVLDHLDVNSDGFIDYRDLLRLLRGSIPSTGRSLIAGVFSNLNEDCSNFVSKEILLARYQPKNHPLVRTGDISESDALHKYFSDVLDWTGKSQLMLSQEKFEDYFSDMYPFFHDGDALEKFLYSVFDV